MSQALGLSIRKAAAEYHIGERRLRALLEKGLIKGDWSPGRQALIPRRELDAYFRPAPVPESAPTLEAIEVLVRGIIREEVAAALGRLHIGVQ